MDAFAGYCALVEHRIRNVHGIVVTTRDIPEPLIGDLDGAEIQIDCALDSKQRLFLLAHLFGHSVQWNVSPRAVELGRARRPPIVEELLPEIRDYEREAASYALSLLHEAGVTGLDQWFSDYSACDVAYLLDYYKTGDKRAFLDFWTDNAPAIAPKAIPEFTPVRRVFRRDGIVI